jgi:hypothetical protein
LWSKKSGKEGGMSTLLEQYTNSASTTLNGSINNSVTSLVVTSATPFPTTGNFRILIDSELMLVTAVSSTTFTVTRGIESTSAASHSSGATVTEILTAGSYVQGIQDRIIWPTFTPPVDSTFSWINQLTGSTTTQNATGVNGIYYFVPGQSGGQNMVIRYIAAPSTPYHIEGLFLPAIAGKDDLGFGMVFIESSSGKLVSFFFQTSSGQAQMSIYKHSSATAVAAAYSGFPILMNAWPNWLRVGDNGTNLTFDLSPDGVNWWNVYTVSRTDYLSTGPNEVGFFAYPANSTGVNFPVAYTLAHWKTTG